MSIEVPAFENSPALLTKREALDKAIAGQSDLVQAEFRKNRAESKTIIDRLNVAYDKARECEEKLQQYENPRWYASYLTYLILSLIVVGKGLYDQYQGLNEYPGLTQLAIFLLVITIGLFLRKRIQHFRLTKALFEANSASDRLVSRLHALGNFSSINFYALYREKNRLESASPRPAKEVFIDLWMYTANEWLNTERRVLNELTQRHSPYDFYWKNELDDTREAYLEKLKRWNGDHHHPRH